MTFVGKSHCWDFVSFIQMQEKLRFQVNKVVFSSGDNKLFPGIKKHGVKKGKQGHFQYFEILWPIKIIIISFQTPILCPSIIKSKTSSKEPVPSTSGRRGNHLKKKSNVNKKAPKEKVTGNSHFLPWTFFKIVLAYNL